MKRKEPVRITPSFAILHDRNCDINPGVKMYVFATSLAAREFWKACGQKPYHAEVERVFPNGKADMLSRINDILGGVYDEQV